MFAQLTRGIRRRRLAAAAVLLAAALLLLMVCAPGLALLIRGPRDLYTLDESALSGEYVCARVDIIYNWYAETVRDGDSADQQTVGREYIIPVGSQSFMGMALPARQLPQAQAVMDATQAVMNGQAQGLDGSSVIVTGTVLPMDSRTQSYFAAVAGIGAYSPQDQARFLPLVLVEGQVGGLPVALLAAGLTAFVLCGVLGLITLVRGILCRGPRQPLAYLNAIAGPEAPRLAAEVEEFYRRIPPLDCLRANCRWVLCENGTDSWLLYNRDIAWVYRVRRRNRYYVVLRARSPQARQLQDAYRIPSRLEFASQELVDRLRPLLPDAVFGYSPRWEALYQADPARFARDIQARQQAARAAAARRAARADTMVSGPSGLL